MKKFINLKELNSLQYGQYKKAVSKAFPQIISESEIIQNYWGRLENYFPEFQLFLVSREGDLVGFINLIPFQFTNSLNELPEGGWDWMLTKGILDFENNELPNFLGGLQVIVRSEYQKLGYSKQILNHSKQVCKSLELQNLIIPIRPTQKHLFPKMSMEAYMNLKNRNEIYDPWIRTHLKSGAQIIKVCNKSMSVNGDIIFWERILNKKLVESGEYILTGALKPITIDAHYSSLSNCNIELFDFQVVIQ